MAGALAGHIFASALYPMGPGEAIGGGADGDTRGRVCSPAGSRPVVARGAGGAKKAVLDKRTQGFDAEKRMQISQGQHLTRKNADNLRTPP